MEFPELTIIGIVLAFNLVSYFWAFPRFVGSDGNSLIKFSLIEFSLCLIVIGMIFWGSGEEFDILLFKVSWFWYLLLVNFVIEFPLQSWYSKRYDVRYIKGYIVKDGKVIYDDPEGGRYEGEWRQGLWHGHGILEFGDGDRYQGEWRKGNWHGQGTLEFVDGTRYHGEFVKNKFHGNGTLFWSDGDERLRAEGEFKKGNMEGKGVLYLKDGGKFEGQFRDNEFHGEGTFNHANGSRYEGEWVKGEISYGTGYFTDGGRYEGEWANWEFNGYGTGYSPDGSRYEGEWANGEKNGLGIMHLADGKRYEGNWKDNTQHGKGAYYNTDGKKYSGITVGNEFKAISNLSVSAIDPSPSSKRRSRSEGILKGGMIGAIIAFILGFSFGS